MIFPFPVDEYIINDLLLIGILVVLIDAGFGIWIKIRIMMGQEKPYLCPKDAKSLEDCHEV
jgi:hypothetical protein